MRPLQLVSTFFVVLLCAFSETSLAQASRTWVSGVGDDANPCSRTAPCKTFAGAISKTAAGGEINAIDSGGFGAVTITKSITIDGQGVHASVLAAGTSGIVINAGVSDVVILRNLSINGIGTGINGVRFLAGAALHVENVSVFGFAQEGLKFAPNGNSDLFVTNSSFSKNVNAGFGGVLIRPELSGTAFAELDGVRFNHNRYGLRVEARSNAAVRNCVAAGNINNGFLVISTTTLAQLSVDNCTIFGNGADSASAGVKSQGALAVARISNNAISDNSVGLLSQSSGAIISFGSNAVGGNGVDGVPTSTIATR